MGNIKSVTEDTPHRRSRVPNIAEPRKSSDAPEQQKIPDLSVKDVAFLCKQTGLSPNEVTKWHERIFRENPNGRLDRIQFRKFYRILRNEPCERLNSMCDHVFRAFDIDGNGYVEFGEFLLGFAIISHGDLRSRLDYAFECYDINSNGYLTMDEIETVLQSWYVVLGIQHKNDYPPKEVAQDLIKHADVSHDDRISKDEFITFFMANGIFRNTMNPFQ